MYKSFFKRILDVIGAVLFLPIILVAVVILGVLIKIEDKGPIFYNAARLGKDGVNFKMFKFRSMKVNVPDIRNEDGSTFNSDSDPRLTKIGKLLRKTSIDEIPQILNVLLGDMSFIGPRPDLPEAFRKHTDETRIKLNVRPGISGYNQAYFRNSVETSEKFRNDVYYVKNVTFIMDCKIFFKTIEGIIFRKNIYVSEALKNK